MQNKGFLRVREIAAMILLLVGVKLSDSTPALLTQKAQNGFWLIPVISFICIFPSFLLMLYLLKKYKDKNLVHLLEAILGKGAGKAVSFIIFLFAFLSMTLDSRNYIEQIKLLYFPESPTNIIFLIFMVVVFLGAKKGFEVIGYSSWIGLPLIKASAFTIIFLVLGDLVLQRIFPIFGSGLPIILKEGVVKASMFAELFYILIAYLATRETAKFNKGSIIAALIAFFEILIFYFIYITVFDYNSVAKIAFPFHDITQFISFGEFFTNIETLFMVFWLFAAFLKFIIFLYITTWIFGVIFEIKDFEPLLLPFGFLVGTIGLLPFNSVINELHFRETLLTIMSPFFIVLPVLLWVIALLKGGLRKK
ncbi:spore germination protein (amino acid permease) [Gracilibacillus ureilyticus]|uniref:Spore germination protein (Amino acid permease) n=1 Tax=Gracilibacillus ureilyticus TaxID=531814 RepID=A0A1H9V1E0_9BACI|nr:endospore germination permease [Gracilibacillus ureilyticus]SES15097.1 spore germination protein (amino acid permease) [Gracilibacillus ureilyticus]